MNFKTIGENNYLDAVKTVFSNRGVEDLDALLNLTPDNVLHHSRLDNIYKAVDCLISHLESDNKIFIQVDSDCDGVCSSAILVNKIKEHYPNAKVEWRMHEGKEHGVIVDTVPSDAKLVIIPDSGTNQYEEHRCLYEKGIDVIVLDHHNCEEYSEHAIVVNNQLSEDYPNKSISGAGIVYKFCKAWDEVVGIDTSDKYLDLVAVGNIGDSMDLRVLETRYLSKLGICNINNPLLKAVIEKQSYSIGGTLNINSVGFYISPMINAVIRMGSMQEKENMFKAMIGSNEKIYYSRKDEEQHVIEHVLRSMNNLKNKQTKEIAKTIEIVEGFIKDNNLANEKVIIVEVNSESNKNLNGLVANMLTRKYRRPAILVKESSDGLLQGSLRGYSDGEIENLSDFLISSNLGVECNGHANASSFSIHKDYLSDLKKYIEDNTKHDIDMNLEVVDLVLDIEDIDKTLINSIAQYSNEWGSTIKEPVIGVKSMMVFRNDISLIGKNKNFLKIKKGNIEMVKPYFNQKKFDELFDQSESYVLDLTCKFKENEYKGRKSPQIQIEKIDIVKRYLF